MNKNAIEIGGIKIGPSVLIFLAISAFIILFKYPNLVEKGMEMYDNSVELTEVKNTLEESKEKIEKYELEKEKTELQIQEYEFASKKQNDEISDLLSERNLAWSELNNTLDEKHEQTEKIKTLNAQIEDKRASIYELERNKSELDNTLKKLRIDSETEMNNLKEDIKSLNSTIKDNLEIIATLKDIEQDYILFKDTLGKNPYHYVPELKLDLLQLYAQQNGKFDKRDKSLRRTNRARKVEELFFKGKMNRTLLKHDVLIVNISSDSGYNKDIPLSIESDSDHGRVHEDQFYGFIIPNEKIRKGDYLATVYFNGTEIARSQPLTLK